MSSCTRMNHGQKSSDVPPTPRYRDLDQRPVVEGVPEASGTSGSLQKGVTVGSLALHGLRLQPLVDCRK